MSTRTISLALSVAILATIPLLFAVSPRWVYGHVYDAETGEPLPGALVTVGAQAVVADGQGYFQIPGVRGLPQLRASAEAYQPASMPLALANLIGLRRELSLRLKPTELRGKVIDAATHKPVAGATVRVGGRELQTDARGSYSVKRLVPGGAIVAQAPYYRPSDPIAYTGQAVQDLALTLLPATVTVRDEFSGEPLAGATVKIAGKTYQSDSAGRVVLERVQPGTEAVGSLKGYKDGRTTVSPGDNAILNLRPPILRGTVRNQAGQPLAKALVLLRRPGREPTFTYTDAQGVYQLSGSSEEEGTLIVRLAGYRREERQLGPNASIDFELVPQVIKGIYIPFGLIMTGSESYLQANLDLVDRTELNAVVIDIKSDEGWLGFQPKYQVARDIGAAYDHVIDVRQLLQECKRRNIYTIARMVVFKDTVLAEARPQWAVRRNNGGIWYDNSGAAWMDPFRQEVWDYNLAIAREAVDLGFDEIQLDYIRFPSDGDIFDTNYLYECTRANRTKAIADFVAYMRKGLEPSGAFFSVDLFGLTTSINLDLKFGDLGIGQELAGVAPFVDYISPMVYPSTYEPGNLELRDPQRNPYLVVKISVADGIQRAGGTLIRPWLQHYSLYGIEFGAAEFRLEKQAAVESGATGWLFWNAGGNYVEETFDPE